MAPAQPIIPPGLIINRDPAAMLAAVQEVIQGIFMASTGPSRAQAMEAIQRQHEAFLIHNMLTQKNMRIQELEVTERLWKEEQKKTEQ